MFAISTTAGRIAVLVVARAVLGGGLLWSQRATSHSFFLGALAGTGLVLSFDIVWVHWIFGLHHVTNAREDVVIEPLLVLTGLVFLWYAVTRQRCHFMIVEVSGGRALRCPPRGLEEGLKTRFACG